MNGFCPLRSSAVAERALGDELVIVDLVEYRVLRLNAQAALIWLASDGRTPLSDIAAALCREYDIDLDTACADALATLRQLASLGVMEPVE